MHTSRRGGYEQNDHLFTLSSTTGPSLISTKPFSYNDFFSDEEHYYLNGKEFYYSEWLEEVKKIKKND